MSANSPATTAQPTGYCYCGCGKQIGYGRYFAAGHDKTAEAAYLAIHHDASVAQMLHAAGYGPSDDKSVTRIAVDKGLWLECPRGCGYRGARDSIRNHILRHHTTKDIAQAAETMRKFGEILQTNPGVTEQ